MRRTLLTWFVLLVLPAALSASEDWPMRWRVYADQRAGIAFRYPYSYFIPDQYVGELVRDRRSEVMLVERVIDGKKVQVAMETRRRGVDVRVFTSASADLPADLQGAELGVIGSALAGKGRVGVVFTWKPYDYYAAVTKRPHADPKWAPPGVQAQIGEWVGGGRDGGACALIVRSGDRVSGLVLSGLATADDNQDIIDSFEVLALPKGSKERITWREGLLKRQLVIGPKGAPVKATPAKVGSWTDAWEAETRHYHITTQVSPARLIEYAAYLEGLYAVYHSTYDPDSVPAFKMEIHVFATQSDFVAAAADNGINVTASTGGFFVPSLMSIFVFQEMPSGWSSDFTVEKVLAHECSHQFLHCTCNGSSHVPTWINEGLAVYFESGLFRNGRFELQPPRSRIALLKTLYTTRKATLRPLAKYLDHYGPIEPEEYGEVYAMTHFWIFGAKEGRKRFRLFWQALKDQENGTAAFERIFMADMIKAQGGRDPALAKWQEMLLTYVVQQLK
ncbi:MAG: hypothetical protein H0W72_03710 [Planctomycetes bacterium]|nr:hypothetical protein [Planctomycetota bacterium]